MATTRTAVAVGRSGSVLLVTWADLASGEAGDAFIAPNLTDATVQIYGTFSGGATLAIEGSNQTGTPTNWAALSEPDGTALSGLTTADIAQILESPYQFRPNVTGGDGSTSIGVVLKLVGQGDIHLNPEILKAI